MKTDRAVQSIVDLVVRSLDPEAVILFGSAAHGRARADSDIDLLVVARFRESPALRGRELRGLLHSMALPVDLHLRTPEEARAEAREQHSIVTTAICYGKTLYGRWPRDLAGGGTKRKGPPAQ